jgi:hypothetical protein
MQRMDARLVDGDLSGSGTDGCIETASPEAKQRRGGISK